MENLFFFFELLSYLKKNLVKTTNKSKPEIFFIHISGVDSDMTPTLKQLWSTVRQLKQDMTQMKNQMNEERALRGHLQQLLMEHLERVVSSNNCN